MAGERFIAKRRMSARLAVFLILGFLLLPAEGVEEWTSQDSGISSPMAAAAFGNGTFVVAGQHGAILTSPDAVEWTIRESGTGEYIVGAAYGNGRFAAVGHNGLIITSEDNGATWTRRHSGTNEDLCGVCYRDGVFVAVGRWNTILTSGDGLNWRRANYSTDGKYGIYDVAYGNGVFVAVGGGSPYHPSLTSPDGVNWTERSNGIGVSIRGITFGDGSFAGVTGANEIIAYSDDGTQWVESADSWSLFSVGYGGGVFVGVGARGTIVSCGGRGHHWQQRNTEVTPGLWGVCYGDGVWVAVGGEGLIMTSGASRRFPGPDIPPLPDLRPQPPENLKARPGNGEVTLTWDESPGPRIESYRVYARVPESLFTLRATVPGDANEYVDRGLTNNVTYTYALRSVNELGLESGEASNTASAVPGTDEAGEDEPPPPGEMPPPEGEVPDEEGGEDDDSSSCFIAGAAYGVHSREVGVMRGFRDSFLLTSGAGRALIRAYYRYSPAVAEAVQENSLLKLMARAHLASVVKVAGGVMK